MSKKLGIVSLALSRFHDGRHACRPSCSKQYGPLRGVKLCLVVLLDLP